MKIAIACDHGAYEYKEMIKAMLEQEGHEVLDFGTDSTASVDYPDHALPCAQAVAKGEAERGIVLCGTGIGVSITANKVKGIRCALCSDPLSARLTREHNDSNMLAMGQRIIGSELAKEIVHVWLSTPFSEGERHQKRIATMSFVRMLILKTPGSLVEVVMFAIARQIIISHDSALDNLIGALAVVLMFCCRKYLLKDDNRTLGEE